MKVFYCNSKQPHWSVVVFFLGFLVTPQITLADGQTISCAGAQAGKKTIYIEHLSSGGKVCRTLYDAGSGQHREIAWAQNGSQFCADVANKLMTKLSNAGWHCSSGAMPVKPLSATAHFSDKRKLTRTTNFKKHKKKSLMQYADYKFLESIKK